MNATAELSTLEQLPSPEATARQDDLPGFDVKLADGRSWTLADHVPGFGPVWDRLYDGNSVRGCYQLLDLQLASARLLLANYDLDPEFAVWLIAGADPEILVPVVEAAILGRPDVIRGWSEWADSALRANAIDPATVPATSLRPVLDQLVATGRAVPHSQFTSAGKAASKRQALLDKFEQAGIKPDSPEPASHP